jgi:hypothetical protein
MCCIKEKEEEEEVSTPFCLLAGGFKGKIIDVALMEN